jgi:hypothetical protein
MAETVSGRINTVPSKKWGDWNLSARCPCKYEGWRSNIRHREGGELEANIMLRSVGLAFGEPWVKGAVLAFCLACGDWAQAEAATFQVPGNGTIQLNGFTTPVEAAFFVQWNNPYPNFDQADFAQGVVSASVNGVSFTVYDQLGTCPVSFCGPPSLVTDNVSGTHLGPGGESTFLISDSQLTIFSNVFIASNSGHFVDDGNLDPIGSPGNYQIFVDLPAGISVAPLPPTLALFTTGLGALGLFVWRGRRKLRPASAAS